VIAHLLERIHDGDRWMRDGRRGTRLAPQALTHIWMHGQRGRQRLERDPSSQPRVFREVDDAHASTPDLVEHFVRTDDRTGHQCLEVGGIDARRLVEECAGSLMGREQRLRLSQHDHIVGAALGNERAACMSGLLERILKHVLQTFPLLRRHEGSAVVSLTPPSIARLSQARASAHCRFTVAGDVPMTSATSSTVRPPK